MTDLTRSEIALASYIIARCRRRGTSLTQIAAEEFSTPMTAEELKHHLTEYDATQHTDMKLYISRWLLTEDPCGTWQDIIERNRETEESLFEDDED